MKINLFRKILVAMLVVAVVPLVTIWYVNHQNAIDHITVNTDRSLMGTAERLVAAVDDWVTTNHKLLRHVGSLPEMVSMNPRRQTPLLKSILKEYTWSFLTFTMAPDGNNIARSDDKDPIYYGDRVYFRQVVDGAPLGKQVLISRTNGKPTLVLAAPIRANDGRTVGVIAISTFISDLSELITKSKIGNTGYAFLLDEAGKVVAHHVQEYVNTSADFSKHPAFLGNSNENRRKVVFQEAGQDVIAYSQKTAHGWTMVVRQDRDDAMSQVSEASRNALILLGLTLLVVGAFAYGFAKRLVRPIENLTRITNEISRGRLDIAINETTRTDEIGALAAGIDRMGTSIRISLQRLQAQSTPATGDRQHATATEHMVVSPRQRPDKSAIGK